MKILIFGENGQVGWELNRSLQSFGDLITLDRNKANFLDHDSLRNVIQDIKPDIIVNAVAYTAVDKAEEDEEIALKINAQAPCVLAEEALKLNALLIHYSTDYIFDGHKDGPYIELDSPNPINAYGRTKLAGEQLIQSVGCDYLIYRTSWVYASRGHNFLLTMLRLFQEREELSVVVDQIGSPTSARCIADTTARCLLKVNKERRKGFFSSDLYHLTASGHTNWHEFATEISVIAKEKLNYKLLIKSINAIPTADYYTPAVRPMNSQLDSLKLENEFDFTLPDWKQLLSVCMQEL